MGVEGRPAECRAEGAHDALRLAGLEEIDPLQTRFEGGVHLLQFLRGGGSEGAFAHRQGPGLGGSGQEQLVRHQQHRLPQVERGVLRRGRDDHHLVAAVEGVVREAAVLTAEDDRHGPFACVPEDAGREFARPRVVALRGARACRRAHHEGGVGQGFVQRVRPGDGVDDVVGAVGDSGDPPCVELARVYDGEAGEAHVRHGAHRRRDVDQVLGLVQDDGEVHRVAPSGWAMPRDTRSASRMRSAPAM